MERRPVSQHIEYGYLPDMSFRIIWTTEILARRMSGDYGIPLLARHVSEPWVVES
jgi:hypothetical protein